MREKMEGVRAYWNGEKFYSKSGREILVPNSLMEGLPKMELDGELWMGRGEFERLNGLLKSTHSHRDWINVKYVILDLPSSKEPYETRMRLMRQLSLPH